MADLCAYTREKRVRYAQVQVFNNLHVVAGHDNARVTEGTQLAARESGQADRRAAEFAGGLESLQNVGRISTPADGKRDVAGAGKIRQLLRENIFVLGVIGPCRHHRHIVGERHHAKSLFRPVHSSFSQITGKVGRQGRTPTIPEEEDRVLKLISAHQQGGYTIHVIEGQRLYALREQLKVRPALADGIHLKKTGGRWRGLPRVEKEREWLITCGYAGAETM